ncbi:differentially expressed in FDCP 8 homolog isoform X3 [Musca domestica]|uniref:Differentially expressed in FDCP 8 homolog isoform X3 n=1 Tax=Musca domestica TaxID=7370 RepID=A0A1I8NBH2_MUSDO|nr:differentially expressed in FDCP 8 homolog isoform X3 [Musca domestica]
MNTLRDSLASIPGAVQNLATAASNYYVAARNSQGQNDSLSTAAEDRLSASSTPTTESLHSFNEIDSASGAILVSEKSLPIPASLVKEQWRLIFNSEASVQDLQEAINHCKDLVLISEENSEERRWLVRHLVDLRYSLEELQEAQSDKLEVGPTVKTVVGHHFTARQRGIGKTLPLPTQRNYCDYCTGIIWSVVQASYFCTDCRYMAHQKCVDKVTRVCAHVIASERQYPILEICPEIGLAAQQYKCMECQTLLNCTLHTTIQCFGRKSKPENSWIEPRLCDYTARVVHNWDFLPRKVSRSALQEIQLFLDKPLIRLEEANPKLFVFLEKLATVKKLRTNLVYMRKYLSECRQALEDKILETQIGHRRYLIQSNELYSINDLEQTENGTLADYLHKVFNCFDKHIRSCSMCMAKAYICEICSNDEVIFPFDDGCIICDMCNSIYHRVCMTRKNMICPKCVRVQERRLQRERSIESKENNENNPNNARPNDI